MSNIPPPPTGHDTWISYVIANAVDTDVITNHAEDNARAELTALRKEHDELCVYSERLAAGIAAVRELIDESRGVAGLHRNGDEAPWDELLGGGRFEDWLLAFSDAETAIAERELRAAPAGQEEKQ